MGTKDFVYLTKAMALLIEASVLIGDPDRDSFDRAVWLKKYGNFSDEIDEWLTKENQRLADIIQRNRE
jgi:hypothetical protein